MAINFPINPVNGQTFLNDNILYTFFSEKQYWRSSKVLRSLALSTVQISTPVISPNQAYTGFISYSTGYLISKIEVTQPAWIVIYSNAAAMANDSMRDMTIDPSNLGVLLEVISRGADSFDITPQIYGMNTDSPITEKIYVKIMNLSQLPTDISVTLTMQNMGA